MNIAPSSIDFLDTSKTQLVNSSNIAPLNTVASGDYIKVSEKIWSDKNQLIAYQKGLFLGRGDHSNILFQEFLKKFRKTIETIIIEELKTSNHTSEGFKDDFKALEHVFNMLINHLTLLNIEIKDEKTLAVLHGFMNSYINSIINVENNA